MKFPSEFTWGAATAAYQVEGAAKEDGRSPSIWDTYDLDTRFDPIRRRTNILNCDNAQTACDHYHRFKEDVKMMKQMGLQAYRFSISWSRVLPDGQGNVNEKGLRFYNDLVDELLQAGIEPYITLYHWDMPQALQDIGGWRNPNMPKIFAEYVKVIVSSLSDRVSHWMTLNEPQCQIVFGYLNGEAAPKLTVTEKEGFYIVHNILLAHGLAVRTIRDYAKKTPVIGIASNPGMFYPKNEEDVEAARMAAFDCTNKSFWNTALWLDPIFLKKYPEDMIQAYGDDFPMEINNEKDLSIISEPIDFLGINLYFGSEVEKTETGYRLTTSKPGAPITGFKWEVTPKIMHYMPLFLYERYKKPIYITENGASMPDWICLDGHVHDVQRIDFYQRYLKELSKAIVEGVPLKGFFAWSLLDNYEWTSGYSERFGLVYVDFETKERVLKDSANWYAKVIATEGKTIFES